VTKGWSGLERTQFLAALWKLFGRSPRRRRSGLCVRSRGRSSGIALRIARSRGSVYSCSTLLAVFIEQAHGNTQRLHFLLDALEFAFLLSDQLVNVLH